jgi:hypothetical protein
MFVVVLEMCCVLLSFLDPGSSREEGKKKELHKN